MANGMLIEALRARREIAVKEAEVAEMARVGQAIMRQQLEARRAEEMAAFRIKQLNEDKIYQGLKEAKRLAQIAGIIIPQGKNIEVKKPKTPGKKMSEFSYHGLSAMFKKKFEKLGEGCYGTVYGDKLGRKNFVYKVGDTGRNIGYIAFVKIALNNQHNPFFPKIHSLKFYRAAGDSTFVVKMEKLTPDVDGKKAQHKRLRHAFNGQSDMKQEIEYLKSFGMDTNNIEEAHHELKILFKDRGNDLHSGNVMFRGEQMVITDPVT